MRGGSWPEVRQIYEVYSQRFQKEDFGEEEKFDPKVLPKNYLENPKPGSAFVYVSTVQRMTINLFGREAAMQDEDPIDDDAEQLNIPIARRALMVISSPTTSVHRLHRRKNIVGNVARRRLLNVHLATLLNIGTAEMLQPEGQRLHWHIARVVASLIRRRDGR